MDAASKSIPNKTVTIRPNDHPWITCFIKNLIRKRKRCYQKIKKKKKKKKKKNANIHYWDKYKILRNTTINEIRKSKKDYYDKLEDMLTSENPNSKLLWKTSK